MIKKCAHGIGSYFYSNLVVFLSYAPFINFNLAESEKEEVLKEKISIYFFLINNKFKI